jgi:hypothetical protein
MFKHGDDVGMMTRKERVALGRRRRRILKKETFILYIPAGTYIVRATQWVPLNENEK